MSQHWRVSVAGEPDSIGTVWAVDEEAAGVLRAVLIEQHGAFGDSTRVR